MGQKSVHIREVSLLQGHAMTVLEEKRSHFLKNGAAAPNVLYRFRPHSFYTFREYINLDVGGESVRSQWFPERDRLLRQTILSPLGGGWSLGGVNRTVGKFQEKRTCSFCPKKFHAKFNFAHIQIYTMVYIYLQYIDHYHECLISRANFAIFLFPWVFDYIIQVPAVTKYV